MSVIRSGWRRIGRIVILVLLLYLLLWLLGMALLIVIAIVSGGSGVIADIPLSVIIGYVLVILGLLLLNGLLALFWVWVLDLLYNFLINWAKRGFGRAWAQLKAELDENWEHLKSGLRQGVGDFVRKVPGGGVIVGGLQKAAQGVKKVIDEGKKLLKGIRKWFGFSG